MTVPPVASRMRHPRLIVASAAAYAVAFAASWLQPVLLAEILRIPGMTEGWAGLVLTIEMLALALSSALLSRLPGEPSFLRVAVAGTVVAIVGNALSMMAANYAALLACRTLCGLGEGAVMMVASAAPARAADPERAYASINGSNILFGAAMMGVTPWVGSLFGGQMTYPTLLITLMLLLPLIALMPASERLPAAAAVSRAPGVRHLPRAIPVLTLAVVLLTAMGAAIWSFAFVLGTRAGLNDSQINAAMAMAIAFALVGTLAAAGVGTRFGRFAPIAVGGAGLAAACFYLSHPGDPLFFRLAMASYMLSLYFLVPYLFGLAAQLDGSGRGGAMVASAFLLALAAGPYLGGILSEHFGYGRLGDSAVVTCAIALAVLWGLTIVPAATSEEHDSRSPGEPV